jgi:hypothetical protein
MVEFKALRKKHGYKLPPQMVCCGCTSAAGSSIPVLNRSQTKRESRRRLYLNEAQRDARAVAHRVLGPAIIEGPAERLEHLEIRCRPLTGRSHRRDNKDRIKTKGGGGWGRKGGSRCIPRHPRGYRPVRRRCGPRGARTP